MTEIFDKTAVISAFPGLALLPLSSVPQQCSKCGAAFSAPLLRGQTEIRCEYCGLVTRL
jgi:hypothetical protein